MELEVGPSMALQMVLALELAPAAGLAQAEALGMTVEVDAV